MYPSWFRLDVNVFPKQFVGCRMFLKIFAYLGENFVENYYNVRYRHSTTKNTASYLQLYQGKRELCNTVEPLKTDITRDRPKCAS